jgi:predicted dehydrogenase/threonine dehydrogenase-like Zn-dependent dehydrogenase
MKQLLQYLRDGKTIVADVPAPSAAPGTALVQTAVSLVSAGTERMVVDFATKSLVGKARSRPDLVRQVLDKARREGLLTTIEAAFNRLDQPMALGYSSAGTIIEVGAGLEGFQVGDQVACAGGGHAVHAEYAVVPRNLLTPLPDDVSFEAGAFTTLGSIALHGFRLAQPQLGERVAVIGLGLLGLLSVEIARAAGCQVFGVDLDPRRVELGALLGAHTAIREDAESSGAAISRGQGFDVVLICADSASNDPIELAGELAGDRGRVVAVGAVGLDIPRKRYFEKELQFIVSRSYGPGRYDPNYEENGQDYPRAYVRWTEGRNFEAFTDLLAGKKINIEALITHRFAIEEAAQAYDLITGKHNQPFLGVLLTYPHDTKSAPQRRILSQTGQKPSESKTQPGIGVLGAGNYASAVFLPVMQKASGANLVGIASGSGLSAQNAARRFKFNYAASSEAEILTDDSIDVVAILTRHHLHAPQVCAALENNKHVYCEKPLATNAEGLSQVVEAMQNSDRLVTIGFNRRFAPLAVKMKAFLDQRVEPIAAHYRVNAGFLPSTHWLHDPKQGGGRIIGEGCHFIDFLTYLVGETPISVSGHALPDQERYHQDNVTLTFTFPDGSIGVLTYLANGDKSYAKENVEVFCGGRIAVLDDFRTLGLVRDGRRKVIRSRLRQDKGHAAAWQAFLTATRSGTPTIPYDHLTCVTRATFAAVESLNTGREVAVRLGA